MKKFKITKAVLAFLAFLALSLCLAACGGKAYEVKFVVDGAEAYSLSVSENQSVYPPRIECVEGVYVEGWYVDSDFEGESYDFETPVAKDLTLYARLAMRNYTVTFNGGFKDAVDRRATFDTKGALTLPSPPDREGYDFSGWNIDGETFEAGAAFDLTGRAHNLSFVATWKIKMLSVNFFDMDGDRIGETRTVPYGGSVIPPEPHEFAPSYWCHEFVGWSGETEKLTVDKEIHARFEYVPTDESGFKFVLNADGESYSIASKIMHEGKVALPAVYNGKPVTEIAENGMRAQRNATELFVPSSYRSLGINSLADSGFERIYIMSGTEKAADLAFSGLNLSYIELPASLTDMEPWAFSGCRIADAEIEEGSVFALNRGMLTFGDALISYSDQTEPQSFTVPARIAKIWPGAFKYNAHLTEVKIEGFDVEIFPDAFFSVYNLTTLTVNGSVKAVYGNDVDNGCFAHRDNAVVYYGDDCGAFKETSLSSLTLPAGLKHIGRGTFADVPLRSISIANTVEYIGMDAFTNGNIVPLFSITMTGGVNANYVIENNCIIEKDTGEGGGDSLLIYANASPAVYYSIPDGVTTLMPFSFANLCYLETLVIPEGVRTIPGGFCTGGYYGAYDPTLPQTSFSSLKKLVLPSTVQVVKKTVDERDFLGNSIWGGTLQIGNYGAFSMCVDLAVIEIPENSELETIEAMAFSPCALTEFHIPAKLKTFAVGAVTSLSLTRFSVHPENRHFAAEDGVLFNFDKTAIVAYPMAKQDKAYIAPDSVKEVLTNSMFAIECLEELIFPEGLEVVGAFAFEQNYFARFDDEWNFLGENGLKRITFPSSLKRLGDNAFDGDMLLESVTFSGPAPQFERNPEFRARLFGYEEFDPEQGPFDALLPAVELRYPVEFARDYWLALFRYSPDYVVFADASQIETTAYSFDAKGGTPVETVNAVLVEAMPETLWAGDDTRYFCGWYETDGTLENTDWGDEVRFPYEKDVSSVTLFARWETERFETGESMERAYEISSTPRRLELRKGIVWLVFTAEKGLTEGEFLLSYYSDFAIHLNVPEQIDGETVQSGYMLYNGDGGYLFENGLIRVGDKILIALYLERDIVWDVAVEIL